MFTTKNYLEEWEIAEALKLDDSSYDESITVNYAWCNDLLDKNKDIYTSINNPENLVNGKPELVGYINFAPVTEEAYHKYRSGEINDNDLTSKDLETFEEGLKRPLNCLFLSLVIKECYRTDSKVFRMLFNALIKRIDKMRASGVQFNKVLSDCVNPATAEFCEKFGYKCLGKLEYSEGVVYEGDISQGFKRNRSKYDTL